MTTQELVDSQFSPAAPSGIPYPLWKATRDPFQYAMGLRDGTLIEFESATLYPDNEWVHIAGVSNHTVSLREKYNQFDRGLDIRISEIVWVADAPNGS